MGMLEKKQIPKTLTYRNSWLQLIRPMTFTSTLSPAIAGTAFATANGSIRYDLFLAILIVGILVQSAVNMLNDYYDFQKGQDQDKWVHVNDRMPGSGPAYHKVPLMAGVLILIILLIGTWVAFESHMLWGLVFGGVGMLCGYKYSAGPRSLSSLGLAEVIAFVFLGAFPVFVGYAVQGNTLDLQIILLAFPYALVASTMLLTNNIRDIKKDAGIRHTLAMRLGRRRAVQVLAMILSISYLAVFTLIYFHIVPPIAFTILVAIPIALKLLWLLRSDARRVDEIAAMKWVAIHHYFFGLTLALSIWIGT